MAEATIPVDLLNPGQVFACLGFMEAAEILLGPCEGRFRYKGAALADFLLRIGCAPDPVVETLRFLSHADAQAMAPQGSKLSTKEWEVETLTRPDAFFPCPAPEKPAALPAYLKYEERSIPIEHWADGSGRDKVKFWAGAGGYPGAALGVTSKLDRAQTIRTPISKVEGYRQIARA
jgi:CRISPR-associated protein Csb3